MFDNFHQVISSLDDRYKLQPKLVKLDTFTKRAGTFGDNLRKVSDALQAISTVVGLVAIFVIKSEISKSFDSDESEEPSDTAEGGNGNERQP